MFETSVIQVAPRRAVGGRLSLLTISIIAHSAVIIGAVAISVASVDFPASAPDEFSQAPVFMPILVPPPLGNPNGGATKAPEPARPAAPPPQPTNQITAPSTVPETVVVAATPSTGASDTTGDPNATSTEPLGVPWGTKDSLGSLDAPPGPIVAEPVPDKIYEPSEVKAPVGLYRPAPPYPQSLIKTRQRATVIVRCVIDKNGRVRDPQVIVPAMLEPFNKSVINTVQQWRFTPGSLNGTAVESYLNLTVNFSMN
ncbi:MAG TPA: energy transducer TonB [Thermoanaerobaculia bacterium]